MYHVEMRQNAQQIRAFNLTDEEVRRQFIAPIRADRVFPYEEMEWDPRRVRLRVLEGPHLRMDQLGMGRGWQSAERTGTEVTDEFMTGVKTSGPDQDLRDALKNRLLGRVSASPVAFAEIPPMLTDLMNGRRASEQLAVAEMAVWEMLHQNSAVLLSDGRQAEPSEWEAIVLSAGSWFGPGSIALGGV